MSVTVAAYIRQHHLALLCLFLILSGGTAYATHPGGANTVSSGDIINDEVRTQDIAAGHVTSQDIGTGEVLSEDIGNSQVALNDLAANSVNSGKLVEGGVQGSDVLDNELTGADVNDNSLTGADVDEDTLVGGPTNPTGPAGGDLDGTYPDPEIAADAVRVEEIRDMAVGWREFAHLATEVDVISIPPAGGVGSVDVTCPSPWRRISGGAEFEYPSGELSASAPVLDGWRAEGQNNGNVAQNLTVTVLCLIGGS